MKSWPALFPLRTGHAESRRSFPLETLLPALLLLRSALCADRFFPDEGRNRDEAQR